MSRLHTKISSRKTCVVNAGKSHFKSATKQDTLRNKSRTINRAAKRQLNKTRVRERQARLLRQDALESIHSAAQAAYNGTKYIKADGQSSLESSVDLSNSNTLVAKSISTLTTTGSK